MWHSGLNMPSIRLGYNYTKHNTGLANVIVKDFIVWRNYFAHTNAFLSREGGGDRSKPILMTEINS